RVGVGQGECRVARAAARQRAHAIAPRERRIARRTDHGLQRSVAGSAVRVAVGRRTGAFAGRVVGGVGAGADTGDDAGLVDEHILERAGIVTEPLVALVARYAVVGPAAGMPGVGGLGFVLEHTGG